MRRMRLVGLALVAMFALSAVVAVAAQAQPYFEREGGGSVVGVQLETEAPSGGTMVSSTNHVKCTKSQSGGEVTGASTVGGVTVTFTGCKLTNGSCTSEAKTPGKGTEEVVTNELKGELVTTKSGSKVGELLEPVAGKTAAYVTLESSCATVSPTTVTGALVGEVKPVEGEFSETGELVYAHGETENEQKLHEYLNPEKETETVKGAELKAFGLLKAGLTQTNTVKFVGTKMRVVK